MFDGSIGAGSVFMPYGGKYQLTETQTMVAKVPVLNGKTETVTMMSYGFDPYVSSWSPYHGAVYAVTESVARIVAAGGDYSKIRFYFPGILQKNDRRSTSLEPAICSAFRRLCGTAWILVFRLSAEKTPCQEALMKLMCLLHWYLLQLMWQNRRMLLHRN